MAKRKQAHALVVGHVGLDGDAGLAAADTRSRVIHSLVKTTRAFDSRRGQTLQVLAGSFRIYHQRQRTGIRRNDKFIGKPALETQPRHSKRVILVIKMSIDRVVTGFGNTPRHTALLAVCDLPGNSCAAGLVDQRAVIRWHHKHRHQILEHRAAPGHE